MKLIEKLELMHGDMTLNRKPTPLNWPETIQQAKNEIERLQRIIDSRPAINAGLPESYIEWSQGIYLTDIAQQMPKN